jgi:hypothetical protein
VLLYTIQYSLARNKHWLIWHISNLRRKLSVVNTAPETLKYYAVFVRFLVRTKPTQLTSYSFLRRHDIEHENTEHRVPL